MSLDNSQSLRLDQFLQLCGIASSGGHAKHLIQEGQVQVNGELETRRRRKLINGDAVTFEGTDYPVEGFVPGDWEEPRNGRTT